MLGAHSLVSLNHYGSFILAKEIARNQSIGSIELAALLVSERIVIMPSSIRNILFLAAYLFSRSASHQLSPYRIVVASSDLARGPPLSPAIAAKAGACLREHGFVIISAECDDAGSNGADTLEEGVVGRDGECAQCAYEAFTHLKGLIATATSLNGQQNISPEVTCQNFITYLMV